VAPVVERRRSRRFACNFKILISWGSAVLDARVVDISLVGMFVKLDVPLWIGAGFAAQLELPATAQLHCVVRRVEPFRGMAVNYSVPDPSDMERLSATLAVLGRL
jgi:hypothetical protein